MPDRESFRLPGPVSTFGNVTGAKASNSGRSEGRWGVVNRQDEDFIGWCGLNNIDGEIDLGYRFFRSAWGQGFATEAARACIEYGFGTLRLSRIIARALPENIASWKVLEKVGMRFTGFGSCKGLEGAKIYEILRD